MATDVRTAYHRLRARSPAKAMLYICQLMFAVDGDLDVKAVKAFVGPHITEQEEMDIEKWRKKWQAEIWGTRLWKDHVYPSIEAYNIMNPGTSYWAMNETQLKSFWKTSLGPDFHMLLVQMRPLAEAIDLTALIRHRQAGQGQAVGRHQDIFEHIVRVFIRACRKVGSIGPEYDSIANSNGRRQETYTAIRQYADVSRRDSGLSLGGGGVSIADIPLARGWFQDNA